MDQHAASPASDYRLRSRGLKRLSSAALAAGLLSLGFLTGPLAGPLGAQAIVGVDLRSLAAWGTPPGLATLDPELALFTGLTQVRLNLSGAGAASESLRAEVSLDLNSAGPLTVLDLSRAWVRARFPFGRLTLGKTRLAWGEGRMFNAGEVIFGGDPDLTAEELRSRSRWLAALYVPLGDFSFVEALGLPPENGPVWQSAGGLRLQAKLGDVQTQAGVVAEGAASAARPFATLQGALGDTQIYGGAGGEFSWVDPGSPAWTEAAAASARLSLGLFHQWALNLSGLTVEDLGFEPPSDTTLSLRFEAQWLPGAPAAETPGWLQVFPELSFTREGVTLLARVLSAFSPARDDPGTQVTLGAFWSPFQGYTLQVFGTGRRGPSGSPFADGWALSAGARAVF